MAARTGSGSGQRTQVKPRSPDTSGRSADGSRRSSERSEHRDELLALGLLGVGALVAFGLIAPDRAGFLGRAVSDGLTWGLGWLAGIVPIALLGSAAAVVLEWKPRLRSPYVPGGILLGVSLLALGGGGMPPIGDPGAAGDGVRAVYEGRAGIAGDLLWGWGTSVFGGLGLTVVSWLGLVAGLSLVTGITLRRAFSGTRRVALNARAKAERTVRAADGGQGDGPLDDPYLRGFGGGATATDDTAEEAETLGMPADRPPEDRPPEDRPPADRPQQAGFGTGGRFPQASPTLLDGATAFPDLYEEGGGWAAGAGRPDRSDPLEQPSPESDAAGEPQGQREPSDDGGASSGGRTSGGTAGAGEGAPGGEEASETASGRAVQEPVATYRPPGADLLRKSSGAGANRGGTDEATGRVLLDALGQFGVEAELVDRVIGPRVTRYELQLAPGTKVSKVTNLRDDLAYALASTEIRILAPIPGKSAVGVEVPNHSPDFVTLGDIYRAFPSNAGPLMVWLGKDISGNPVYTDLAQLPHLLIAGTTGSGKSGCINCILASVLLRASPEQVKMIMIDPKKVELSHFDRIPHLLVPVVTNMKNAAGVLHNITAEMENRYELMELDKARHLEEMNKARRKRGESPLPYIMVVIDELADLMMFSPTEVEEHVIRLAQKARAVGIHLVVATQRPSADVITGMIKANIPSRIAFAVSSQTDSRVILDVNGAESLLGQGDMLFKPLGQSRLQRVQGAYISEEEIELLVHRCKAQAEPEFDDELLRPPEEGGSDEGKPVPDDYDELLPDAAELILDTGTASVSMLQRRLRVGYTRAGRLIDMLERRGIVGPYEGSRPRSILVGPEERSRVLEQIGADAPFRREEQFALEITDSPDHSAGGTADEEVSG